MPSISISRSPTSVLTLNPSQTVSPEISASPSSGASISAVPSNGTPSAAPKTGSGGALQSFVQLILQFIMAFITFILQLFGFKP
jgi:hypothetical protein